MVTDAILDTSVLIDLLRAFPPSVDWFASLGRQRVAITPIVWMETIQGATHREKRAQALRFLRRFRIEHPTEDDNRWAMRVIAPGFCSAPSGYTAAESSALRNCA